MDMSIDQSKQVAETEMTDPDQFRPAKKSTVEPGGLATTEEVREEMADEDEAWDDIYGTNTKQAESNSKPSALEHQVGSAAVLPMTTEPTTSGIKVDQDEEYDDEDFYTVASEGAGTLPLAAPGEHEEADTKPAVAGTQPADKLTAQMADAADDDLVDESKDKVKGIDEPSSRMVQETSELEQNAGAPVDSDCTLDHEVPNIQTQTTSEVKTDQSDESAQAEFTAAAKALKDDPNAEFELDSSPEESSSDDSSSDEESDDSDDDIDPTDPEVLSRMLMEENHDDGKNANQQPRTQNEQVPSFEKPDVNIRPDTKITLLGKIDSIVENNALIIANESGREKVMEVESVLCNDQRQVIGVIHDAIGKIEQPHYVVGFQSPEEIKGYGLDVGSSVHYVNEHAKFVFTSQIQSKGTDASNIHDEEAHGDDIDFSDDEIEAEYKRKNKESKRAGRGALSRDTFVRGGRRESDHGAHQPNGQGGNGGRGRRGGRGHGRGGPMYPRGAPGADAAHDRPQGNVPSVLKYDEDDDDDGYTPLKRPADMTQPQRMRGPPTRGGNAGDRGMDRGRGRTRGDGGRARSDGGRGRGGGGRGRGDWQGYGRGGFNSNHQHQQQAPGFAGQPQMAPHQFAVPPPAQSQGAWPAALVQQQAMYPQSQQYQQAHQAFQQPAQQGYQPYAPTPQQFSQPSQPYAQPQQSYAQPQQSYAQPLQSYAQSQQSYAQYLQSYAQYQQAQAPHAQAAPSISEQWAQHLERNPSMGQQQQQQ